MNQDRGDFKKRRRSPSPEEPKGEIQPLHLRPRKLNFWDERPKGYENMTAEQVKATGMFLLPCHLLKGTGSFSEPLPQLGLPIYQPTIDYQVQSEAVAGRNTKRLYVGGLPEEVEPDQLVNFINDQYDKAGLDKAPGKPALAAVLNKDKKSGLVEFRTTDETTMALKLDGVEYNGTLVKVRRPKDYKPGAQDPHYVPGVVSSVVQDSMFKVFIGGLPTYVSDEQVMDLLKAFGELKSFNLVKDGSGVSKGFGFCEFLQPEITDIACEGLHGLEVGDKKLIVQRASVGASRIPMIDGALPGAGLGRPILPIEVLGANGLKPAEPTKILLMLNMVSGDDLEEDADYDEILDDIRKECELFGPVVDLQIPRPNEDREIYVAGVGKVFVKYENKFDAAKAQRALAGRKYMGNTVLTTFYDEQKYEAQVFE